MKQSPLSLKTGIHFNILILGWFETLRLLQTQLYFVRPPAEGDVSADPAEQVFWIDNSKAI